MVSMLTKALGVFQYFLDGGIAREDTAQPVLAQSHHPELDRLLFQYYRGRAFVDQFANWIGNAHQLVDSFAAFVTGLIAGVATFAVIKTLLADVAPRNFQLCERRIVRVVSGSAIRTDAAEQPLTENRFERGGNQKRFDAHVDQTRDSARRVVRLQGCENKMSRERRLNGNLRRLQVARLTDHDAVGILP